MTKSCMWETVKVVKVVINSLSWLHCKIVKESSGIFGRDGGCWINCVVRRNVGGFWG